jgi:NTE family protein
MLAFVLGGGGTKGAAQAGAIRALLERDIVPDMLVGTSAGAINAAHIAAAPTLEGMRRLEDAWRALTSEVIFGSGRRSAAWRTVRGRSSLYASDNLRHFLAGHAPELDTFASLGKRLYIVASELRTGRPHVFGDRPNENVLDAVIASTAIPPVFPPVLHNGVWLVDGGVSANLPLRVAIQRGATEVYAIDISNQPRQIPQHMRVWTVTELSIGAMIRQQIRDELAWTRLQPGVTLHYLRIPFSSATGLWDVEDTEEFLELGYASAKLFLIRRVLPQPERSFLRRVWQAVGAVRRVVNAMARGVASALKFAVLFLWRPGDAHLVEDVPVSRDGTHVDGV